MKVKEIKQSFNTQENLVFAKTGTGMSFSGKLKYINELQTKILGFER